MNAAGDREKLWQKYKGNNNILMFDVYTKETHPAMASQAKTFEERIKLYKDYQKEKNMTVPALIDDMENSWKSLYLPGPTGCILIDKRGIVMYTIQFIMQNVYNEIGKETDKLLNEIEAITSVSNPSKSTFTDNFQIKNNNNGHFSIVIPDEGAYTIEMYNVMGSKLFSKNGHGTDLFHFNNQFSSGKYLIKLLSDKQSTIRTIVIR